MRRPSRRLLPEGLGVALALAAAGLVELMIANPAVVRGPRAVLAAVVVVVALTLYKRRQMPLAVLVVQSVLLAAVWLIWGASQLAAPALAVAIAVFSCGRYGTRPLALIALPVGAGDVLLHAALDPASEFATSWTWALNVLWIFGAGAWLRQKEQLLTRTQAEAAERERAAAIEERLRLARDLHDILAHNLAVIIVQAEAGAASGPSAASLNRIATIGRKALTDLRALLPALREGDHGEDHTTAAPPHVGVDDLPSLANRLSGAGLDVRLRVHSDELSNLPPAVAECVYRLVQEGLTNAVRHSECQAVDVTIERCNGELHVLVDDAGPAADKPAGTPVGYGLQGMRERITSLGGSVSAGPRDTGFRVEAALPLQDAAAPQHDRSVRS
jgi:signal transduction histidine kinase